MGEFERALAINDLYRTAALNRFYYAARLRRARLWTKASDIIVAAGSSTAIAAWTLWQDSDGRIVWQGIGGTAAVVGVLKPVLRLNDDVQRYGELVTGYAALVFDCETLTRRMRIENGISEKTWDQYESMIDRMREMGIKDDTLVNGRLLDRCTDEVNRRIPMETLWWPKEIAS